MIQISSAVKTLIDKVYVVIKKIDATIRKTNPFKGETYLKDKNKLVELLNEAYRWVGVHEFGPGKNSRGVDAFRKAVDGVAQGEAWCAAFVQYCIKAVCIRINGNNTANLVEPSLYPSESVIRIWEKTPKRYRLDQPLPGSIAIWNWVGTRRGHTGIVLRNDGEWFYTIEGNTKHPDGRFSGMGTGVYVKKRRESNLYSSKMKLLGFLYPFNK